MPKQPPRPVSGPAPPERVTRAEPAAAPEAVGRAAPVEPAAQVAPAGAVERVAETRRSELVASIARRLRGGELSAAQAVEELIEETVRESLPEPGPLSEELHAALRAYVDRDPYLSAKVHRLARKR
jgi:ribosomal protein L13